MTLETVKWEPNFSSTQWKQLLMLKISGETRVAVGKLLFPAGIKKTVSWKQIKNFSPF